MSSAVSFFSIVMILAAGSISAAELGDKPFRVACAQIFVSDNVEINLAQKYLEFYRAGGCGRGRSGGVPGGIALRLRAGALHRTVKEFPSEDRCSRRRWTR